MSSFGSFCQNISSGLRVDLRGLLGQRGLTLNILAQIGLNLFGHSAGVQLGGSFGGGLFGEAVPLEGVPLDGVPLVDPVPLEAASMVVVVVVVLGGVR